MLYGLVYLWLCFVTMLNESTALTKANSFSVRCSVGRKVIASEMRQENKIVIFLDYDTMKCDKQFKDQTDAVALSKSPDEKLLSQLLLDRAPIHKLI